MDDQQESIVSFEFFPPKTPEGMQQLMATAQELRVFSPSFYSVTFGAGGSTRSGTAEVVRRLQQETGLAVAPHISCVGSSADEILAILSEYQTLGIKRLVALRGDLPSGMGHTGEFHYASELVALIRRETGDHFHIEVAAYPEFHPQAKSAFDDVLNLQRKYDAGADSAITQYFFNPDAYFYYLEDCAHLNIDIPIVPGIMPITQFTRLARFSDACGAEIPRWLRKRLENYGDDVESIKAFGLEFVSHLCETLLAGGAPGLHFYTLNKSDAVIEIIKHLDQEVVNKNEDIVLINH